LDLLWLVNLPEKFRKKIIIFLAVFEISYDIWGLAYSLGALAMQTSSLVLIEKVRAQMDMSVVELIYLNSFNCLCLFLVADIVQDELRDAYSYLQVLQSKITNCNFAFRNCNIL